MATPMATVASLPASTATSTATVSVVLRLVFWHGLGPRVDVLAGGVQFGEPVDECDEEGDSEREGTDSSTLSDDLASQVGSGTVDAKTVFQAFEEGDAFAAACLDRVARMNAAGIASSCKTVNPGLITLGSGVALNNSDWIRDGIDTYLDDYLFVERPEIKVTQLRDDIGLYGALATRSTAV